jgi:hypothetical protein
MGEVDLGRSPDDETYIRAGTSTIRETYAEVSRQEHILESREIIGKAMSAASGKRLVTFKRMTKTLSGLQLRRLTISVTGAGGERLDGTPMDVHDRLTWEWQKNTAINREGFVATLEKADHAILYLGSPLIPWDNHTFDELSVCTSYYLINYSTS